LEAQQQARRTETHHFWYVLGKSLEDSCSPTERKIKVTLGHNLNRTPQCPHVRPLLLTREGSRFRHHPYNRHRKL
jgi:hypothetical protein